MNPYNATNPVVDDPLSFAAGVAGPDHGDGDGYEDIEHQGQVYSIPRALKPALMMHGDYTRKTQELAEQRRAWDDERAQHAQAMADQLQARAAAFALDSHLSHFEGMDWEGLVQEDPEQAHALYAQYEELREAQDHVHQAIEEAEHVAALEAQRDHHEKLNHGHSSLAAEIMDWSPEMAGKLAAFGQDELGFTPAELSSVTDPRLVKLLHRAWQNASSFMGNGSGEGNARAQQMARGQATQPAQTLGGSSRYGVGADTNDFAAFEKLADARLKI
jgi:hypothetical protein